MISSRRCDLSSSLTARRRRVLAAHFSTSPSSRPMVSMNSSTMSSTTERAGRTRSTSRPPGRRNKWPAPEPGARMRSRLVDAHLRLGDQCRLQRHPERAGVFRPLPLVGPGRAEHSRRFAGHRPRPDRVRGAGGQEFLLDHGHVSASSVVSHTDPHHTPSAPRASAAAICGPGRCRRRPAPAPAPPRRRPRGPAPWSRLRRSAAGLGALGDDQVDTGRRVSPRVLRGAGQRGHQHFVAVGALDEVRRRRPSALAISRMSWAKATRAAARTPWANVQAAGRARRSSAGAEMP